LFVLISLSLLSYSAAADFSFSPSSQLVKHSDILTVAKKIRDMPLCVSPVGNNIY